MHEITINSTILDRIEWAEQCYDVLGSQFIGDEKIRNLLTLYKNAIMSSSREMVKTGLVEKCRDCEERDGGSCCGKGLENHYSGVMLLINLLLGRKLGKERYDAKGCLFLGENGCNLLARNVICVNYLCSKITSVIKPKQLAPLREKEGTELDLLFNLNERIKEYIKRAPALKQMIPGILKKTLLTVAEYYDQKKVGDSGPLGFRRSTDLTRLMSCVDNLVNMGVLDPGRSVFLDMGCADGRVNVLMSYIMKRSIGIELDEWTLEEYGSLKSELENVLLTQELPLPPDVISLFHGDSMDETVHEVLYDRTGIRFGEIDLFYTYLTMQPEFGELIARKAKKGAVFMVYGLAGIIPELDGFKLLTRDKPMEGILALYQKL